MIYDPQQSENTQYLDNIIYSMNNNFNCAIEYENKQKEKILYNIFDKVFIIYQKNIDKNKLNKPVRINDFLKFHHFKKIYSNKYNICGLNYFEEELIVYNFKERIYIKWNDIIKPNSDNGRYEIYEQWKQKKMNNIQYMGELCLFFLDLFMSGKVYYNLNELLEEYHDNVAANILYQHLSQKNKYLL